METQLAFKPKETLTFTSLTKNRSRCNQTGDITKHPTTYALAKYDAERKAYYRDNGININAIQTVNNSSYRPSQKEIQEMKKRGFYWSGSRLGFMHY